MDRRGGTMEYGKFPKKGNYMKEGSEGIRMDGGKGRDSRNEKRMDREWKKIKENS